MRKSRQGFSFLLISTAAFSQWAIASTVSAQQQSQGAIAHHGSATTATTSEPPVANHSDRYSVESELSESLLEQDAPRLSQIDHPATTLHEWMAQISESVVEPAQITDIQLNVTDIGVDIMLVTESGMLAQPTIQQAGNALIIEIPNAVLDISGDDSFQQFDPAASIVLVEALTVNEQAVRLTITGTDAPPMADIAAEAQTLVLTIAVGDPTTVSVDDEAIQVVVTGEQGSRYVEPNTSTATRTNTPLRDIPQSIQVIPREVIEDQQLIQLTDVVRNASGVLGRRGDSRNQSFISRGFGAATLRDGFRINFGGFSGNTGFAELSNLETVEVLKGPASILFGALEPGGVINLVSEQPSSESFYDLGFRVGNRDLIEPSLDLSGPLTDDGRLAYRLNALYRSQESFRDFDTDIERFFVAPTLRWQISNRTDLTLSLEYSDDE
ncbi:MAG: TonB-dependent receptor plug domain-containing protein [Cyanobacteria bacterium P01_E01_bin.6]